MPNTLPRILIVEDDHDLAAMLADHLARTIPAQISLAHNASDALKLDLAHPHDLLLADLLLPDADAFDLIRQLNDINNPPVILITAHPTLGRAVEAMRLGVRDLFAKPFDLARLGATVRHVLDEQRQKQAQQLRNRRLRHLSGRIIRQRRQLRQRLDLLCRDFVEAYRRLAEKVVEHHQPHD